MYEILFEISNDGKETKDGKKERMSLILVAKMGKEDRLIFKICDAITSYLQMRRFLHLMPK